MGARKKLSQSIELKLNRLSFFLCPQTPGDQCERPGFRFAEPFSWRGYGGCSERKQWAEPIVFKRAEPTIDKGNLFAKQKRQISL
jgi:hypothetical protein